MRNKRWLRTGLASLTIGGLALSAFVVACGDDDTVSPPPGGTQQGTDSGTDGANNNTDSGTDSGTDAAPRPKAAKLQLVNAAGSLGANNPGGGVRICFRIGQSANNLLWAPGLPPLPNRKSNPAQPFPGLFIGTGGSPETTGTDLSTLILEPFLIKATSLESRGLGSTVTTGQDKDCETILGRAADGDAGANPGFDPLVKNVDFWQLPSFPAQSFLQNKSYLLVLTGCSGDAEEAAEENRMCGNGWTSQPGGGVGTLAVKKYDLDNAAVIDGAKFGAQFVHASPNADLALDGVGGVRPELRSALADGGVGASLGFFVGDGGADSRVTYSATTATALTQFEGVTPAAAYFSANSTFGANLPFQAIAQFSKGTADAGGTYPVGAAYTFIALGQAGRAVVQQDGGIDLAGFHVLALPNEPADNIFDPTK